MDFKGPLLSALSKAKTSVWTAGSAKCMVDAIVSRAAVNKPISAEEAAYIYYLMPQYVLYSTPPLRGKAARGSGPATFGINPQRGVSACYWNCTHFSGGAGALVTLLVQLQIDASAGISTWALCCATTGGVAKNGVPIASRVLNTTYFDSTCVTTNDSGVSVSKGSLKFSIAVTPAGYAIAYSNTVKGPYVHAPASAYKPPAPRQVVVFNIAVTSARGPVYQHKGGSIVTSGASQKAGWSIVDGVATGSLSVTTGENTAGADVQSFQKTWSWLDCQQLGFAKLSDAQAFVKALLGGGPFQAPPSMRLVVQTPNMAVTAFFSGRDKVAALLAGKSVQAGTTTVWKTGQAAAFGVTAKAKTLSSYSGPSIPSIPSKVELTLEDGTRFTVTSTLDSIPGQPPLLPTVPVNCNTYVASASVVEDATAAGVMEWQTASLHSRDLLQDNTNGVPDGVLHATAPSRLAQVCVLLLAVTAVLFISLLTVSGLSLKTRVCGSTNGRNTAACRSHRIAAAVLAAATCVFPAGAGALVALETSEKKKTHLKCAKAFLKLKPSSVVRPPTGAVSNATKAKKK